MRKSVAVVIAGATAVVVSAWRQIQRDNTIDQATTGNESNSPKPKAPQPETQASSPQSAGTRGSASALFTPSVSEKSTKADLYEVASEMGVEGRSKMTKAELLKAIRAAS